jgi:organic radical activating enzyme
VTLRTLNDRKGQALIDGVLELVDRLKPLHLSIVGGDPLVRYRELEQMIPSLLKRGIHVQVVTSAFRPMSPKWAKLDRLYVVVSIDGLAPEHDVRRAPATYDRILKNIAGQNVTIHPKVSDVFQSHTTLANVRSEHHDRFAVPDDINEPVAVDGNGHYFNYSARWNRSGAIQSVKLNDRMCGRFEAITLPEHGAATLAWTKRRFYEGTYQYWWFKQRSVSRLRC